MATTTPSITSNRWQIITNIWQKEQWLYGFVGALAGFIFGIAASRNLGSIVNWFASGFWNEALSIAITVIVLDRLNRMRDTEQLKMRLIREAGSRSNSTAITAIDWMQRENWLVGEHGLLKNQYLGEANLHNANLRKVNLESASLELCNLEKATLDDANLIYAQIGEASFKEAVLRWSKLYRVHGYQTKMIGADLYEADFTQAYLRGSVFDNAIGFGCKFNGANLGEVSMKYAVFEFADFEKAHMNISNLTNVNLQNANLKRTALGRTNLSYAILGGANFKGADLDDSFMLGCKLESANSFGFVDVAEFDENTVLPDGCNWSPTTDMTRFTDPNHPNFWQPTWVTEIS
jgi:uncharacterized protein YjbI with pentapeptide repeats